MTKSIVDRIKAINLNNIKEYKMDSGMMSGELKIVNKRGFMGYSINDPKIYCYYSQYHAENKRG